MSEVDDGFGSISRQNNDNLISLPSHLFIHFTEVPCSIYVRTSRGFELYLQEGQSVTKGDLGIRPDIFIERQQSKKFFLGLIDCLKFVLTQKTNDFMLKSAISSEVNCTFFHLVRILGFRPQLESVSQVVVRALLLECHSALKNNALIYIQLLRTSGSISVNYKKIQLSCFLTFALLRQYGYQASRQQEEDIASALYFSEIGLYQKEKDRSLFDLYYCHAFRSHEILKMAGLFSDKVLELVIQHHGSPIGLGHDEVSPDLNPLSYFLIFSSLVANELVTNISESPFEASARAGHLRREPDFNGMLERLHDFLQDYL